MKRLVAVAAFAAALAGCAGQTDRLSPCVCDYRPIGAGAAPGAAA